MQLSGASDGGAPTWGAAGPKVFMKPAALIEEWPLRRRSVSIRGIDPIMLDHLVSLVVSPIVDLISAGGYAGIAALMAIESACIPLPSEVIMPFAGYLVSIGKLNLIAVATAGAIGCNIGSTVAYYVAVKGGRPAFERWGSYVLVAAADFERAERFFARYGSVTVFVARLLPVVRTFIAFPAGLARMPMLKIPGLHLPRLLALVLRARLCRLRARRPLAQRSDVP